jgi:hypothetical protein
MTHRRPPLTVSVDFLSVRKAHSSTGRLVVTVEKSPIILTIQPRPVYIRVHARWQKILSSSQLVNGLLEGAGRARGYPRRGFVVPVALAAVVGEKSRFHSSISSPMVFWDEAGNPKRGKRSGLLGVIDFEAEKLEKKKLELRRSKESRRSVKEIFLLVL